MINVEQWTVIYHFPLLLYMILYENPEISYLSVSGFSGSRDWIL